METKQESRLLPEPGVLGTPFLLGSRALTQTAHGVTKGTLQADGQLLTISCEV